MARRGENVYKRKDGRWEGRILLSGGGYRYFYAKSYSELKEKMNAERRNSELHKCLDKRTVSYFTEMWLYSVKLRCKQSTYSKYVNICKNHILPMLGKMYVEKLENSTLNMFLSQKAALAPKTLNDILCVFKMILAYAEENSCKSNINIKAFSIRIPHKEMRTLSVLEQMVLIRELTKDIDLIKLGIFLALCTGIRIGELCALKRSGVSFENRLIHIGGTMQRIQTYDSNEKTKIIITEPKSRSSVRDIPLIEPLITVMQKNYGDLPQNAFLLTGSSDKSIEPGVLRYHFKKTLENCGITDVHFHTLRHTFATRCVEAGMDIKTLSEILGHVNVKITLDRYVHSSISLKRDSMEKVCFFRDYLPSNS